MNSVNDIFGEDVAIGDTVLRLRADFGRGADYAKVVKVNEKSVLIEYFTPKKEIRKTKRIRLCELMKLNDTQIEHLKRQNFFNKLKS